jgi:hypothetical protein
MASVVDVRRAGGDVDILVHYKGCDPAMDEWLAPASSRVSPQPPMAPQVSDETWRDVGDELDPVEDADLLAELRAERQAIVDQWQYNTFCAAHIIGEWWQNRAAAAAAAAAGADDDGSRGGCIHHYDFNGRRGRAGLALQARSRAERRATPSIKDSRPAAARFTSALARVCTPTRGPTKSGGRARGLLEHPPSFGRARMVVMQSRFAHTQRAVHAFQAHREELNPRPASTCDSTNSPFTPFSVPTRRLLFAPLRLRLCQGGTWWSESRHRCVPGGGLAGKRHPEKIP